MKPVLAFCGAAGAGKDSVAKQLEERGVVRYGFARPLKTLCAYLFGWDEPALDELAYKEAPSEHGRIDWTGHRVLEIVDQQFNNPDMRFRESARDHLFAIFSVIEPDWTRRRILQWVGTEGFRAIDVNHWTKRAFLGVRDLLATPAVTAVALTDLRFLNEAEELRREFPGSSFVIRVERIDGPQATTSGDHASEQEWSKVDPDFVLKAKFGELPLLYQQMDEAWTEIREKTE